MRPKADQAMRRRPPQTERRNSFLAFPDVGELRLGRCPHGRNDRARARSRFDGGTTWPDLPDNDIIVLGVAPALCDQPRLHRCGSLDGGVRLAWRKVPPGL